MIRVYYFKVWDQSRGEHVVPPRKSTADRNSQLGGVILTNTAEAGWDNDNPADNEALAEDLEDDDPREEADHPEDDDPGGTDCGEGLGTPAPMSPQMRAIDADYLARQRQR